MTPSILHVVYSLPLAGMERVVVTLANGLQDRGWEQTICCLRQGGELSRFLSDRVGLIEIGSPARDWKLAGRLRRIADHCGADLIHGQNLGTWCDVVRAFAGRYPIIQSFHGFLDRKLPLRQRALAPFLAARTQRLLAVSRPLRREMARRFKVAQGRIDVVPNGVDTEHFAPRSRGPEENEIRAATGHRFLCLTVASLSPPKSPETLVEAARLLPDGVALIWVGTGPLEHTVRRHIEQADLRHRFHLLGAHSDVRPFLRAADLFVLPSRTEGLPMCLLEAMAAGLPVVATRVGAVPELVADGDNGLLAEPGDPGALAECVKRIFGRPDLRNCMSAAARESAARNFGLEKMLDRHETVYRSLTEAGSQLVGAEPSP